MKDRWKFCQNCYLNGRCENQDRDMKCETYPKQLEDKIERLQEQLKEANDVIYCMRETLPINPSTRKLFFALNRYNAEKYLEKWGPK